jgi:hypothetical protein
MTAKVLPERVAELTKSFLSALFMGLRTARIHDQGNRAFENAVRTLYDATQGLYAATDGFRIVFIGDTTLVNDERLRVDGSTMAVMRSLRTVLEDRKMGGLVVQAPPTFDSSRALIELLRTEGEVDKDALARAQLAFIPPQAFADEGQSAHIDPNERAIRVYAKLLIGLRSHLDDGLDATNQTADLQRVRLARVVQDLVEVSSLAPAALLLLANHHLPEWKLEQQGAGVCALAVAMGQVLGLDRASLMDLGVGAALHHLGVERQFDRTGVLDDVAVRRGFFRGLTRSSVSPSTAERTSILANHRRPVGALPLGTSGAPTLKARIVGLCATYMQLTTGFGLSRPVQGHAVDVLALLVRDNTRRFDPDLVDLLINMLRAFPVGVEVVLASGGRGVVSSHGGGRRWDRPVVAQIRPTRRNVDLMLQREGRFVDAIVGTAKFLGAPDVRLESVGESEGPQREAAPITRDLQDISDGRDRLREMPDEAEALLKEFLQDE